MRRESKRWLLWLRTGVVSLCLCGVFLGCRRPQATSDRSVAVRVIEVKKKLLQRPIIVFGQTEPWHQSALGFQVSGVVSKIDVEDGDAVKSGQALAELDKESIKLNVKLSQARYWEAAASYRKVKKGYRKEVIQQYYSSYMRAKATHQKAKIDLQAGKRLKKQKAISDEQYERYVSNFRTSKAAMEQAWQAYRMYLKGYQKEDIQVAGVKTTQARTQLALAKKQLKDSVLRAPFAGTVAQRRINVGELIATGSPAIVLMDLSRIKIQVGVPERVISSLRVGQKAYVSFQRGKPPAIGRLERKGVVIDKSTLTYPVDIIVPNPVIGHEGKKPIRKLLPGKIVFVAFPRQGAKKGISVPLDAVLHDGQKTFVFVERKGVAKRLAVTTGQTFRNQLVVSSGLKPGDKVVVAGQHQLDDGRKLFVIGGAK